MCPGRNVPKTVFLGRLIEKYSSTFLLVISTALITIFIICTYFKYPIILRKWGGQKCEFVTSTQFYIIIYYNYVCFQQKCDFIFIFPAHTKIKLFLLIYKTQICDVFNRTRQLKMEEKCFEAQVGCSCFAKCPRSFLDFEKHWSK